MPSIRIIAVGKAKGDWPAEAASHFIKLIGKYASIEVIELPEVKKSPDGSIDSLLRLEGASIIKRLHPAATVVACDSRGKDCTSEEFASYVSSKLTRRDSGIDFVIGGANGLSAEVRRRAESRLPWSRRARTE